MDTRGQSETNQLIKNIEQQLDRLVAQLSDLESCKADLEKSEYEETKQETIEQLKEFNESLIKMKKGDITLIDEIGSIQLAIQAAISEAFHTPDIIRMFAKKQPNQLRSRLSEIERDAKIGTLNQESFNQQKLEILAALKRLGDPLTDNEKFFLKNHAVNDSLQEFISQIQDETVSEKNLSNIL